MSAVVEVVERKPLANEVGAFAQSTTKANEVDFVQFPGLYYENYAAQMAAVFLHKAGGKMPVLKLMSLMYLTERLHLQKRYNGITYDAFVSMKHGSVLYRTNLLVFGMAKSSPKTNRGDSRGWPQWISAISNDEVSLVDQSLLESPSLRNVLNRGSHEAINEVWGQFGFLRTHELSAHTKALPEWVDPGDQAFLPIAYPDLFKAIGFSQEASSDVLDVFEERADIARGRELAMVNA